MTFARRLRPRAPSNWLKAAFSSAALVLVLPLLLLLPGAAPAQPEGLQIQTEGGFDGFFRPGAWTPVFVSVSNLPDAGQTINDLEEFNGQLMMITQPVGEKLGPMRFARDINVPPSSRKRYTLFTKLPDTLNGQAELLLNAENGKLLQTFRVDFNRLDKDTLLAVNVSTDIARPSLPLLRGGLDKLLFAKLGPNELPDHWAAWDSADMVVLEAWPADGMTEDSRTALLDWVAMGGTLLLLTGQNMPSYTGEGAAAVLPVTPGPARYLVEAEGTFRIQESAPDPDSRTPAFLVSAATPAPETQTLLQVDGVPLVVRRPLGTGQIVYFATDFQSSNRALEALFLPPWQAIIPQRNLAAPEYALEEALNNFASLTGRAAKPPQHVLIILICLLYTVIVGPVNFGILTRHKRLEWAWFTVPAIVLLFFFLIYGLGRLTKGNIALLRELEVREYVEPHPGGSSRAFLNSFVSDGGNHLLRPTAERFALADAATWAKPPEWSPTWLAPLGQLGGAGPPAVPLSANPPMITYDPGQHAVFASSWHMGTFEAHTFEQRGPLEDVPPVESNLQWNRSGLRGSMTNVSDAAYVHAWLVAGNMALPLGSFNPGETFTIPAVATLPSYGANPRGTGWQEATALFQQLGVRRPETGMEVAANNFALLMNHAYFAPSITGTVFPPQAGTIQFLGLRVEPEASPRATTTLRADVQSRAIVVRQVLHPTLAEGPVRIPAGQIALRMLNYSPLPNMPGDVDFTAEERLEIRNSVVTIAAQAPLTDPALRVSRYMVDLQYEEGNAVNVAYQVYRWGGPQPGWSDPQQLGTWYANNGVALPATGRFFFRLIAQEREGAGITQSTVLQVQQINVEMEISSDDAAQE